MTDIGEWFNRIPVFTKYWLTLTVGLTLIAKLNIVSMMTLILNSHFIFKKFQIWRIFTALFFYPIGGGNGFHFMFNCYFLYNYSNRLETDHYKQSPGDYFFLLIFNWICCVIIGLIIELPILMDPMVLSVLYIWCQLNKDTIVSFWFGTRFKAMYLPWVLLAFNFIMSSGSVFSIIGIVVGHLYFFLKYTYPLELGGPNLIETPQFLKNYFPDVRGGMSGFGVVPENRQPNQPQGRSFGGWGSGRTLGRD